MYALDYVVTSTGVLQRSAARAHLSYEFKSQQHAQQGYGQAGCHAVDIALVGSCCS